MLFEPGEFDVLRILLVEDDSTTRAYVRKLCNRYGVGFLGVAHGGLEGLKILTQGGDDGYNLIISDWNMPDLSGIELLERLRAAGIELPFVMMTARRDMDSVSAAKRGGVSSYLLKPFRPEDFLAQLRRAEEVLKGGVTG